MFTSELATNKTDSTIYKHLGYNSEQIPCPHILLNDFFPESTLLEFAVYERGQ